MKEPEIIGNYSGSLKITRKSRRKKIFGGCSCWKWNIESIISRVAVENKKEKRMFLSVEERYTLFEQMVEEANKIIEEKHRLLFEEIKEKQTKYKND